MPSNKNAVIRYMYLDQMLSDRYHKYTCEDLLVKVNERLEFAGYPTIGGDRSDYDRYIKSGKRVIQLDIQALQEAPFNMVIDCSERIDGAPVYRYADQTQSLFSKQISDDEKRLLQEVLNTLGQFSGLDNFEWLHDLQDKLNDKRSFGRGEYELDERQGRKIISFSTNEYLVGKDYLGLLFSLISNKKVVDVAYQPFGQEERVIRLYPYLLKQYNDRWYLIGTPLGTEQKEYRKDFYVNLPLDRMNSIQAVEGLEYIECEEGFEERYEDIIGVTYYDKKPDKVILAVKESFCEYVETSPLHGSQTRLREEEQAKMHARYPALEDYSFYMLDLRLNREFYSTVYRLCPEVVIVSPEEVRDKMAADYSQIIDTIKKLGRE